MDSSELFWELLVEHLNIDASKLKGQKDVIRNAIVKGYGDELPKADSVGSLLALNEKIENEKYGKKNFLEEIRRVDSGTFEVKLLSYKCPFHKIALKNPGVCDIHGLHYKTLGELCGWDFKLKTYEPKGVNCIHELTLKRISD